MRWTLLAALALAAACSSAPRAPARTPAHPATTSMADDQDDDDVICQDERMTGTNLSKTVCRTQAEIDEERNAAMDWEKRPRNGTSGIAP
jgi:starvation-inducible outer membrane lipoprotein